MRSSASSTQCGHRHLANVNISLVKLKTRLLWLTGVIAMIRAFEPVNYDEMISLIINKCTAVQWSHSTLTLPSEAKPHQAVTYYIESNFSRNFSIDIQSLFKFCRSCHA